jgi:hypothetical protein
MSAGASIRRRAVVIFGGGIVDRTSEAGVLPQGTMLVAGAQAEEDDPLMRCPKCQSDDVTRSRLRPRDWALLPLLLRPLRCLSCHRRFYRPFWVTAARRRY